LETKALIGNNAGYEQQGWGQHAVSWGCRLATDCNNAGYEQQGWGQHEASWGCMLATYSTYWQQCGL